MYINVKNDILYNDHNNFYVNIYQNKSEREKTRLRMN